MARPGLRIVVFPETGGRWTARALEHDIAAQGRTIDAAVDSLLKITGAHIEFDRRHNREPLSAFAEAPRLYWNAFGRGARSYVTPDGDSVLPPVIQAVLDEHPALCYLPPISRSA